MKRKTIEDISIEPSQKKQKFDEPLTLKELYEKKKRVEKEKKAIKFVEKKKREKLKKEEKERKKREKMEKLNRMREERMQLFQNKQKQQLSHVQRKISQEEINEIRKNYLEKKSLNQRKYIKPSEKFKVIFNQDWDPDDDTSYESNPLFRSKEEYSIMFGRGKRGGVDNSETNNEFYDKLLEEKGYKRKKKREEKVEKRDWRILRLDEMTEKDWRIFKEGFEIFVKGSNVPLPLRRWEEGNLPRRLLRNLERLGYKEPSAIQRQCIPIGLHLRDLLGIAETGSGKTAAFGIPLINFVYKLPQIDKKNYMDGPYGLIVAPARELAQQIVEELTDMSRKMGIKIKSLVGGVPLHEQTDVFLRGCEILVATPGRLHQCLTERRIVLNQCHFVVLDEADKMIEMKFEEDLKMILNSIPFGKMEYKKVSQMKKISPGTIGRTLFLFSATMPLAVEKIVTNYLTDHIRVSIGEIGRVVDKIEQKVLYVKNDFNMKLRKLAHILEPVSVGFNNQVIVFVNEKKNVEKVHKYLKSQNFSVTSYHGGKDQRRREGALEAFKNGQFQILVCTDLAGRGINIVDLTHVVNFDMPKSIENYKHRIGRTGRMGREGVGITLITDDDEEMFYEIRRLLIKCGQKVPPELESKDASKIRYELFLKSKEEERRKKEEEAKKKGRKLHL